MRVLCGWAVCLAIGLFAAGIPFIYFSSVVKQDSSDVAVALALLVATLHFRAATVARWRHAWLLGVGGMAACDAGVADRRVRDGRPGRSARYRCMGLGRDWRAASRVAIVVGLWLIAALATAVNLYSAVPRLDREYFQWFWRDGFMPLPPRTFADVVWLPKEAHVCVRRVCTRPGAYRRWPLLPVVACVRPGDARRAVHAVANERDERVAARWPAGRGPRLLRSVDLSLHRATDGVHDALPAAGDGCRRRAHRVRPGRAAVSSWRRGACDFRRRADLRARKGAAADPRAGSEAGARARRRGQQPGDQIYVYYGAALAFRHYAPREHLASDVRYGGCHLADPRGYLRELDCAARSPADLDSGSRTRSGRANCR